LHFFFLCLEYRLEPYSEGSFFLSISKGSQSDLISVIMDVQSELVSPITSETTLKKGGEYFMVCGVFTSLVICLHLEMRGNYPLQLWPNLFSRNLDRRSPSQWCWSGQSITLKALQHQGLEQSKYFLFTTSLLKLYFLKFWNVTSLRFWHPKI